MNDYFLKYKPFLLFLGKFFFSYLLLTVVYQFYLGQFSESRFEVDHFTQLVAKQSSQVMSFADATASVSPHGSQPAMKLFYKNQYVARVVEGCNAVSVMILFMAFVIAFTGKFRHTIFYLISGCLLIHILNIIRIALLAAAIFYYPQYGHLLHGVIFPLFIYSIVFILWVIWVNKFSLYAKKPA